jgi:hypothetical protein
MLLEQLVEEAGRPPRYDWDCYYSWLFSELAGREVTAIKFWLCEHCHSVNVVYLPAKNAKCRGCELIYLPGQG